MARRANGERDGHSSGAAVARRLQQPTRAAGPDGPENAKVSLGSAPLLFGLAPGGVCRAVSVAGNAVRSYRTVSPLPRQYTTHRGGLLSVALSLGLPPPDVIRHRLSWSPDFPPRPPFGIGAERPSGRLTR